MTQTPKTQNSARSCLKKLQSKYLLKGTIIILVISCTPFIFYMYRGFPEGPILETTIFTYESSYFQNVSAFAWMALSKLIPLLLLLIWFFTCKHWWHPVILIPIAMYIFQLISLISNDIKQYDQVEIYLLAPIIIIVLGILYTIRTKLFDGIHDIDLSEINKYLKHKRRPWWDWLRQE